MDSTVLLGLAAVLGISMVPVVVFFVLLHLRDGWDLLLRALRRVGLLRRPLPRPSGPSLEQIVGGLRRLYPEVHDEPTVPMTRLRGITAAYDDLLLAAARALSVRTELPDLRGLDLEGERLRVEHELEVAGLSWH